MVPSQVMPKRLLSVSTWEVKKAFTCQEAGRWLRFGQTAVIICPADRLDHDEKSWVLAVCQERAGPKVVLAMRYPTPLCWAQAHETGGYDVAPQPNVANELICLVFIGLESLETGPG